MNYLRNPLNASRRIKRSDANIAQTITLRGGVCGDHCFAEALNSGRNFVCLTRVLRAQNAPIDGIVQLFAANLTVAPHFNAWAMLRCHRLTVQPLPYPTLGDAQKGRQRRLADAVGG